MLERTGVWLIQVKCYITNALDTFGSNVVQESNRVFKLGFYLLSNQFVEYVRISTQTSIFIGRPRSLFFIYFWDPYWVLNWNYNTVKTICWRIYTWSLARIRVLDITRIRAADEFIATE